MHALQRCSETYAVHVTLELVICGRQGVSDWFQSVYCSGFWGQHVQCT